MKKYLVLDFGGTYLKYSCIDEDYNILDKGKIQAPVGSLDELLESIDTIYVKYSDVSGIAISMPGKINSDSGTIIQGGAYSFFDNTHLADILEQKLHCHVTVQNDCKCAILAEMEKGSLKDFSNGVMIVIGTGLGGAIMLERKLVYGTSNQAGEFSRMVVNSSDYNNLGELWCAKNGVHGLLMPFAYVKNSNPSEITGEIFFEEVKNGDEDSINILRKYSDELAVGIYNLQCVLDVDAVVIGGGISVQSSLINAVATSVQNIFSGEVRSNINKPQILAAKLNNDANLIGALIYHKTIKK